MRRISILISMLAVLHAIASCSGGEESIRFRITYTFDTPSGERSGSHVLESFHGPCTGAAMGPGCRQGVRGDAAVIKLGEGKTVFAILAMGAAGQNVDGPVWIADIIYKPEINSVCKGCTIFRVKSDNFPPRNLLASQVFTLVTFKDLEDPASAAVVYSSHDGIDTVAQTFGSGFAFKGAKIEMANDSEITRGIESKFPILFEKLIPLNSNMRIVRIGEPLVVRTGQLSIK